jgi:uncharacterized membrane protein
MNRWLIVAMVLTVLAAAASVVAYFGFHDQLPEQVPIHWNIRGEVDGSVPRDGALSYLLVLPEVMAGVVLLTLVLPWLSPRQFEVDRFRDTYFYFMALVVGVFAYIHAVALTASLQIGFDFNRVLLGGMFLFLAAIGNVLGKVQRNFWMGVRTPWTLASEAVWVRTHRLAAWLFVAGGLAGFVGTLIGLHPVICFSLFGVAAIWPVFYSLILYKRLEKEGRL